MSKIIVRRQEYANNGTHANEIEAVVKENLIANTLSSATDIAPSVGLLKSVSDSLNPTLIAMTSTHNINGFRRFRIGRLCVIYGVFVTTSEVTQAWRVICSLDNEKDRPLYTNAVLTVEYGQQASDIYFEVLSADGTIKNSKALGANITYKVHGCWIAKS